jgi:hypothetical protein
MPGGRPTVYDEQTATKILDSIADGSSLKDACETYGMKTGTVAFWVVRDHHGFRQRYFEAFGARCVVEADQILSIVDEVAGSDSMARVQAARARADMRRWLSGRMLAEFSEKFVHQHQVEGAVRIFIPHNNRMYVPELESQMIDGEAVELLEGPDERTEGDGTD